MGDAERPTSEGGFYIVISHASRTRVLRKSAPIVYHCSQSHVPAWALHEQNRYIPSFPDTRRVRTLSITGRGLGYSASLGFRYLPLTTVQFFGKNFESPNHFRINPS